MKSKKLSRYWRITASATGLIVPFALGTAALAQPPAPRSEVGGNLSTTSQGTPGRSQADQTEGVEYLTRGPLHEAFADPYDPNPQPSALVQKQPPEPIDELPPEYRPQGNDVIWISGYWSWDDERNDFIWVSGVWRDLPPGQSWVPGYWDKTSDGYLYISGFWASNEISEVQYLPEPPKSPEQGPSSPAPGENHFYVPGSWVYESGDYQWRPGFWSASQDGWVWVPSQYIWTPRGCIHQTGYWDHEVTQRGVLFTPVYYSQPIYQTAGYSYRPSYTIDTSAGLFVNLFVRPSHRHYYYGDYYGSQYSNQYYPWVTRYQSNQYYDPFYASYNNRGGGRGSDNLLSWITNQYQVFAQNDRYRPARTIADQRRFLTSNRYSQIDPTILQLISVGESLDTLANNPNSNLQQIGSDEVDRIRESVGQRRELIRERLELEGSSVAGDASVKANAKVDADGRPESNRGDRKVDPNARAQVNAEGRGSLRLPRRDRSESSPKSDSSNVADKLSNDGKADASAQPDGSSRSGRGDAAMQRARDAANRPKKSAREQAGDKAGDAVEDAGKRDKPGDKPRDTANSAPKRMDPAESQTEEKTELATPADSVRNSDPKRGSKGASDRVRKDLRGKADKTTEQSQRPEALRPERPKNWPSQRPSNAERGLPQRPSLNNASDRQPGNMQPKRRGSASPGPAPRGATETPAPKSPAAKSDAAKSPAPKSSAPQSPAPQSPAPQSPAPKSPAPQSPAPQSPAPKSSAPKSPAPQSPTPQSDAPQLPAPESD